MLAVLVGLVIAGVGAGALLASADDPQPVPFPTTKTDEFVGFEGTFPHLAPVMREKRARARLDELERLGVEDDERFGLIMALADFHAAQEAQDAREWRRWAALLAAGGFAGAFAGALIALRFTRATPRT